MSQEFWDSVLPAQAETTQRPQIGAAQLNGSADATRPMTRREARERRESEAAAAMTANRVRPRRQAKVSRRVRMRPASVLPAMTRPRLDARALVAKLVSFGAMVGVAGMLVATSVPANAFFGDPAATAALVQQQEQQSAKADIQVQSVGVDEAAAALTAKAAARDSYTVVSLSDQLRKTYGTQQFSFTNNPNGTIQWPFAASVPISSGFGDRIGCSYCSSNHLGVDFVPGLGAPIQSIADGVVREVNVAGGAYGVNIVIDHEINGEKITTLYAHMMWGSPAVAVGQTVTVGQYIGDVGSTGASTGPHLHFEVHVNDTPVDPFVWLKANAN